MKPDEGLHDYAERQGNSQQPPNGINRKRPAATNPPRSPRASRKTRTVMTPGIRRPPSWRKEARQPWEIWHSRALPPRSLAQAAGSITWPTCHASPPMAGSTASGLPAQPPVSRSIPERVATPGAARIRRAAHLAAGASCTQGLELQSRTRAVAVPPTRISLITGVPSGPGMAEIAVAAALASRSTSFPRNSTTGFPRL